MNEPRKYVTQTGKSFVAYPWTVGDGLQVMGFRVLGEEAQMRALVEMLDRKILLGQSDYDVRSVLDLPTEEMNAIVAALTGNPGR